MFPDVVSDLLRHSLEFIIIILWIIHSISDQLRNPFVFVIEHFLFEDIIPEIRKIRIGLFLGIFISTFKGIKLIERSLRFAVERDNELFFAPGSDLFILSFELLE